MTILRTRRLQRAEIRLLNRFGLTDLSVVPALDRLSRHEARHERSFYRALHVFELLRETKK